MYAIHKKTSKSQEVKKDDKAPGRFRGPIIKSTGVSVKAGGGRQQEVQTKDYLHIFEK